MARRPRIGPVRKAMYDAAVTARHAAASTSHEATKAIHEVSAQYLEVGAKLAEILEDFEENGVDVEAAFTFGEREYKIPIKLNLNPGNGDGN